MNTDITIPAAFYDSLVARNINVPQEQEIRLKGKGKQYLIDRNDQQFTTMVVFARQAFKYDGNAHAENLLRSLEKQGIDTGAELPVREAKPVTRKTTAIGDRRNLIVTITPEGELILRPAGRRKSVSISLSAVYSIVVNSEARKAIRDAQKARKEKRMARRAERDAAVAAFKSNPTSITL
jgi:predicted metal-binding transcription factor (methanogenesis marker protein 9)